MRQDWIFYLVLSGCLLRKRYYALGGAAFAYSTLLRVFPGTLAAGWAVVIVAHFLRHKTLAPSHLRLLAGGAAATVILVAASIGVAGKDSYAGFWKHIKVHNNNPLTNNMGLQTIMAHSYAGRMQFTEDSRLIDPFAKWKQMRREELRAYGPLYLIVCLAVGLALVRVAWRVKSLWIVQALSLAVAVSLVEVTCYYYSMFILAAFLARLRRSFEIVLLTVAGVSQILAANPILSYFYDDRYTLQSLLFFGFSVGLILAFWPAKKAQVSAAAKPSEQDKPVEGTAPPSEPALPAA